MWVRIPLPALERNDELMSRSYKKTPKSGDENDKVYKKYANRKVRRLPLEEPTLKRKAYRKVSCSWDICDYKEVGTTFEEYWNGLLKSWLTWGRNYGIPYPNREQAYKDYLRWFIRK